MKTATELKNISIQNSPIIKHLENYEATKIEEAAKNGERYYHIESDKFPYLNSRVFVCEQICEYLRGFGYSTSTHSNNKIIQIKW